MADEISTGISSNVAGTETGTTGLETLVGTEGGESAKRRYELKIDGADEVLELDDDEIKEHITKARGAEKRFREAATMRKEITDLVLSMKENPIPILQKLGIDIKALAKQAGISARDLVEDPHKWAEELLLEKLEDELATPEQKEIRAIKKKLEEMQNPKKPEPEQKKAQEVPPEVHAQIVEELQTTIIDAIKAEGFTPTPKLILQMTNEMIAEIDQAGKVPDARKTIQRARNNVRAEALDLLNSCQNDADLLKVIPAPLQARLRKAFLAQVRSGEATPAQKTQQAVAPKKEVRRYKTLKEIFDD